MLPQAPGDPDIFFPKTRAEEAEAIGGYCLACPVSDDCDARGEEVAAKSGIWGGRKKRETK